MGFDTEGFLGSDAQRLVDEQQGIYADLFEFAHECSTTALKSAVLPIAINSWGVAVGVMFARCIAQFQGSVILAERGLPIESMLLTRALNETTFVLGALAQNKVTPEELADSDIGSRAKIGNAILPMAKEFGAPEHHLKLAAFIAEHNEAVLSIYDLATKAGMLVTYNGLYRHLSHFAAHPSISAASAYYVEQPDKDNRVIFRPLTSNSPKAILLACTGIMLACGTVEKAAQTNSEISTEIKTRLDREELLYQKYHPLEDQWS